MDEGIPSMSSGSVGSRFVSQTDLDKAKAVRDEQWKAAYARIGQEPPPRPEADADYDGRSLYERLESQKAAKQEKWEDEHRLSKQFRALEEDEILFLDAIREKERKDERTRRDQDSEEVDAYKQAVAAREQAMHSSQPIASPLSTAAPATPGLTSGLSSGSVPSIPPKQKQAAGKKDQKTLLKGIVKKKPASAKASQAPPRKPVSEAGMATSAQIRKRTLEDNSPTESASHTAPVESSQPKRKKTDGPVG